ncbi:Protoporphyrinogen oxidase [Klenkia soli]|uniref:Protoporphyrinogen oxidase n=1 Tax=Klenkia soli TaxID=1052260 RepID=A0A1H0J3R1_9ACTN|nr:FAD-dependent oxidoreductase [Klenkia soli]SDO37981.1 Protoporphyrinogen oxidase [Klenkia soli]
MAGESPTRTVVVGGGMLGASVAGALAAAGREVTLLEAAPSLGGLASAWQLATPDGPVVWDRFYHVVLEQDTRVRALLAELELADSLAFRAVGSELLAGGRVLPMSSVVDFFALPGLTVVAKLRILATMAVGALTAGRPSARRITTARWLTRWSGTQAAETLWAPLLRAKLGVHADAASSVFIRSTFARLVRARLAGGSGDRFGQVTGGYATVLGRLADRLRDRGVEVATSARVAAVVPGEATRWTVRLADGDEHAADDVVLCTPGPAAAALAPLPPALTAQLAAIPYLGCVCVSVLLRRQLTGGYLTYVTDETPYTAVVEMTNLVGPAETGGLHLVYLPRYVAPDDPLFDEDPEVVAERFVADLVTRYPDLQAADVVTARTAAARYVMPVPTPSHPGAPAVETGVPGLYLASSAQVTSGTLNVETTLRLAEEAVAVITREDTP